MSKTSHKIMIVAGEASGDLHAAKLVTAIRDAAPEADLSFFGAAGTKMREAGVEPIVKSDELSVVGLAEIGRALPMFLRVFSKLKRAATERRPDVVVLVDFPDFNLKLARALKKRGFKIVYYISPQLWAWRQYRMITIRRYVDLVISILPFEKDWYAAHGIHKVEYVGSPLAREVFPSVQKDEFCANHGLSPERPIVALLPGSRHKEIVRILPVMLRAASEMADRDPEIQFVVAVGTEANAKDARETIERENISRNLVVTVGETFDAVNAADVAAVASGTATLETGILGTPMAIVYKTSALNYKVLRPLIDVEHFGLINLIAGGRVAKELIQDDFTPISLAEELLRLLESEANHSARQMLNAAAEKLGHGGASRRAADLIMNVILAEDSGDA
jgi:lipid-A-disaccharide synthase